MSLIVTDEGTGEVSLDTSDEGGEDDVTSSSFGHVSGNGCGDRSEGEIDSDVLSTDQSSVVRVRGETDVATEAFPVSGIKIREDKLAILVGEDGLSVVGGVGAEDFSTGETGVGADIIGDSLNASLLLSERDADGEIFEGGIDGDGDLVGHIGEFRGIACVNSWGDIGEGEVSSIGGQRSNGKKRRMYN